MAEGPSVGATTARSVATAAVVGVGVVWVGWQVLLYAGAGLPVIGVGAWVPILLLAAVTGWLAWQTHSLVQRRREPLEPDVAVVRLRLAKTSLLAATALASGYGTLALLSLSAWPTPSASARVIHGAIALVAGICWAGAGWLLERACRIPKDPDEEPAPRPE